MNESKILRRIFKDKNVSIGEELIDDYLGLLDTDTVVKMILKDKKFLNNNRCRIDRIKWEYIDHLEEDGGELKPSPTSKINYIGIEIECFTKYDRLDLMEKISDLKLDHLVQATGDGSIDADFGDDLELRILTPEKKLTENLKKINKLFTKGKFGVNNTCGLHIHLDMRNRDVDKCYDRLIKFQHMLFALVKKERWNNEYCQFDTPDITQSEKRYVAINKTAYHAHKTIEIRLHHATLDMKRINQWVQLLLKIIAEPRPPVIKSKDAAIKWAKKHRGLSSYVEKNFDEHWFKVAGEWAS